MNVYVVTTGQATYEDNVVVERVYKNKEEALAYGATLNSINYDDAIFGDYWYRVEELELY